MYPDVVTEDLRLVLLLILLGSGQYSHNEHVLRTYAKVRYAHSISADKLRTELHWLQEQSLVSLSGERPLLACLTERGADVARGSVVVPGVKRPQPG